MDYFGENVFGEDILFEMLPEKEANVIVQKIHSLNVLDNEELMSILKCVIRWAKDKGVMRYAHWFQPLSGVSAQRYDNIIFNKQDGMPIESRNIEKMLHTTVDAEAFPHGGLRSFAISCGHCVLVPSLRFFIKNNTLFLPAIYVSHEGDSLDKKLPLLRSQDRLANQVKKLLNIKIRILNIGIVYPYKYIIWLYMDDNYSY